jgi:regulator of cell morphogenesis and NO signaling
VFAFDAQQTTTVSGRRQSDLPVGEGLPGCRSSRDGEDVEQRRRERANHVARGAAAEVEHGACAGPAEASGRNATPLTLTALADHIEATLHAYLRRELPRLTELTGRVAIEHGAHDPRLRDVCDTFLSFAAELSGHLWKEEQVLFPMVRQLEASREAPQFHCGSLANPMRQIELEHGEADDALERLRGLTDGFTPPEWACRTYRELLAAPSRLEQNMHVHIQKENNDLFPRALEMEAQKRRVASMS